MEIKKIQYTRKLQPSVPNAYDTLTFPSDIERLPIISLEKLSDNVIYVSDSEQNTHMITLSSQDILKLMTWLVGQEKHKDELERGEEKQLKKFPNRNQHLKTCTCGHLEIFHGSTFRSKDECCDTCECKKFKFYKEYKNMDEYVTVHPKED